MTEGKVKFFNVTRGFGFITPDEGGPDVFCHIRDLRKTGIGDLKEGQVVKFDIEENPKGIRAANVVLAR